MKLDAETYGIDPEKVVVMGDSSGGHTAMMAGFTSGIAELEEDFGDSITPDVKGVVDFFGPVNFATMNESPSSQDHSVPTVPRGWKLAAKMF